MAAYRMLNLARIDKTSWNYKAQDRTQYPLPKDPTFRHLSDDKTYTDMHPGIHTVDTCLLVQFGGTGNEIHTTVASKGTSSIGHCRHVQHIKSTYIISVPIVAVSTSH